MRIFTLAAPAALLVLAACGQTGDSGAEAAPVEAAGVETSNEGGSAASRSLAVEAPTVSAAESNLVEALAYLAENGARDGVITTPSGLQYEVIRSGAADGQSPALGQYVCVHYRGEFLDGTEFDSSYSRGQAAAFPSDQLIRGWVEALQMMKPGDAWKLHIHPNIAYGAGGRGDIPPNAALVFDLELIALLEGPVRRGVDCAAG